MKKAAKIVICATCLMLLLVSWFVTVNIKTSAEKQIILINQASILMEDDIFIRAAHLLEEAVGYNAKHTVYAENELKKAYLALINKKGFSRKYLALLEKQMSRKRTDAVYFIEATEFYLSSSKIQEALLVLKRGIEKTKDENLIKLYESNRYAYEIHRPVYEEVLPIFNQTVQVKQDGKWGITAPDGTIIIPFKYDRLSNFNKDRVIVQFANDIFAVDRNDNKIAVTPAGTEDFGNFADGRVSLLINGNWLRASGDFESGTKTFQDIRMYSNGFAAAKEDGKWGVINLGEKWLIPAEFDGIITDELGRSYAQDAVFVRHGQSVYLISNGRIIDKPYEDAHPFGDEGYAAVKIDNKWGFIDSGGVEVIPFIFDDALSFGQHLAAVRLGDYWGFINKTGEIVIDTVFFGAKSFSDGSAPVQTERGWQILTLIEYKKGLSL